MVRPIAAGIGAKTPSRVRSRSSYQSCTAEPTTNCQHSQANMNPMIDPITTSIARRSRAHATPDRIATK